MEQSAFDDDVVPHRGRASDELLESADDQPFGNGVGDGGQRNDEGDLDQRGQDAGGLVAESLLEQPVADGIEHRGGVLPWSGG